jgi:hypothetical protein
MEGFMKKWFFLLLAVLIIVVLVSFFNNFSNSKTISANVNQKKIMSLYPAYIIKDRIKKWGYINDKGRFIIKPQYDSAEDFMTNGLAKVSLKGRFGIIDKAGENIVGFYYSDINNFRNGVAIAHNYININSYRYFIINESGKIIFENSNLISEFSDGLSAFTKNLGNGKTSCGYVDKSGKVVIDPQYEIAGDFVNGKALVRIGKGTYGIINNKGSILKKLYYDNLYSLRDDVICYSQKDDNGYDKYGFICTDGKVLISAKFTWAARYYEEEPKFHNGLAIVSLEDDSGLEYGLINKKGEYIIPPKHGYISEIGNGLYSVSEGNTYLYGNDYRNWKKAIFDGHGRKLTDFKYYDIKLINDNEVSVTDDKETYIINKNGKESNLFKKFKGAGFFNKLDKLYKLEIDGNLYYFNTSGKEIWRSDNTFDIGKELKVERHIFRSNRFTIINYPQVRGGLKKNLLNMINSKLKQNFIGSIKVSKNEKGIDAQDVSVDFNAEINKDLLIITYYKTDYPIGNDDYIPDEQELQFDIDLKDGTFYNLHDLFKKGTLYKKTLVDKIRNKMVRYNKLTGRNLYAADRNDLDIGNLEIKKDAIYIYYSPCKVTPDAEGASGFSVPYKDIMSIIDINGKLWNSFDKDVSGKLFSEEMQDISVAERANINETIKGYEKQIINAINKEDFKLVKPWLLEGSSLYNSQESSVKKLYAKGIKEKFIGCAIEKIEKDKDIGLYNFYVSEKILVKYPGKNYIPVQYKWIYTAEASNENGIKYQLVYKEKWNNN